MIFALSFVIGHNLGFANGRTEGYENGHTEGYETGYTEGYDNGHSVGYSEGYTTGYENGYDTGYDFGYDNGIGIGRAHGYNRWNPTYAEMLDFIRRDKTNENEYAENVYTCWDFTADVCRNADTENIRIALVYLLFAEGAHTIVAFDTIDRGLVFIEPQSDERMYPEIGESYWPRPEYLPPDYDDTIVKITIVW